IEGLSADQRSGSRSSQMELHLGNAVINDTPPATTFFRSTHIDIVNHLGHSFAPLIFEVQGESRLLNNSTKSQDLNIYFESIGQKPIQFGENTKFSFLFSCAEENSPEMHFGTSSQVNGIGWNTPAAAPYNKSNTINPDATSASNPSFSELFTLSPSKPSNPDDSVIEFDLEFGGKEITNPNISVIDDTINKLNSIKSNTLNQYKKTFKSNISNILKKIETKDPYDSNTMIDSGFYSVLDLISSHNSGNLNNIDYVNGWSSPGHTDETNVDRIWTSGSFDIDSFNETEWDNAVSELNNEIKNISKNIANSPTAGPYANQPLEFYNGCSGFYKTTPDAWSEDFKNFLVANFELIIKHLISTPSGSNFYSSNYPNRILPTPQLYNYLTQVQSAFKNYLKYRQFLLPINTPITKENWINVYSNAVSYLGDNNTIDSSTFITESGTFDTENFFLDPNVLDSANTLVKSWKNAVNTDTATQEFFFQDTDTQIFYMLPTVNLFEYFKACYELDYYNSIKTVQYYINPTSCMFSFKDLILSGNDGVVLLHIKVENLPGYWDTDFTIPINKVSYELDKNLILPKGQAAIAGSVKTYGNIIVKGNTAIGGYLRVYSYAAFAKGLTVNGATGINGELKLGSATTKGKLNTGSRIEFNSAPNIVSIEENWGLNLFGDNKHPVKVKNSNLEVDGSIGIGTENPTEKLEVNGRIKDKTGFVMPVGSIIAFGGKNAPEGWLICDGQKITKAKYPDLYSVLNSGTVPDLRSRFILGATSSGNNILNKTGGEESHQLTTNEMPTHGHQLGPGPGATNAFLAAWYEGNNQSANITSGFQNGPSFGQISYFEQTQGTGNNQPHNNMPPYWALTYIIKY
ncbi:MAG: tail fiber protein, partial [Balneola sp.]